MNEIHSYPKIYNLGHRALKHLFDDDVVVEEKVDGSQFSFGRVKGALVARSKNREIDFDNPGMFAEAIETVKSIGRALVDGWTYRGEYLKKPKHNALAYGRVPKGHIILYDIDMGDQDYFRPELLELEARALGLESVPVLHTGMVEDADFLKHLLHTDSILGKQQIEGVVIKNYYKTDPFNPSKILMGKLVSEAFRETHKKTWGESNPGQNSFVENLAEEYRTPMRWQKAVQHLRDQGLLTGEMRDMPALIREVSSDIDSEDGADIAERLYKYFWKKIISRRVIKGLPEWYKERLLEEAFDDSPEMLTQSEDGEETGG